MSASVAIPLTFAVLAWSGPLIKPTTAPRAAAPLFSAASSELPAKLLSLIEPTDRGVAASPALRSEITAAIEALEATWTGTDAFAQPDFLLRRTEVAYVGQAVSNRANAAGGKFRGKFGRLLFQTEALFQHVLADAVAVNVIQFRLLGLLRGCAVLPGKWSRPSAEQLATLRQKARERSGRMLSDNTIAVQFAAPRIAFGKNGNLLNLQFGPASEVALDTTYLDDSLRICRGAGSGVPFVFRADSCREGATFGEDSQQWEAIMSKPPLGKPPVIAFLLATAAGCWRVGFLGQLAAIALCISASGVLRSTGGIVVDERPPQNQPVTMSAATPARPPPAPAAPVAPAPAPPPMPPPPPPMPPPPTLMEMRPPDGYEWGGTY